jgi:hypothetical protein
MAGVSVLLCLTAEITFGAADLNGIRQSADMTARFLAGMAAPVDDTPWALHARELDQAWKRADQQVAAIQEWTGRFLTPAAGDANTVFYMFSGPDFLYAHALFPNARSYILCGNEPVGPIPSLSTIPSTELPAVLANLRKSLGSVLNWSFFITKNMKTDLTRTQLNGTLPLLYVFIVRSGCSINDVSPVTIDETGNINQDGKGQTNGVRITLTNGEGSNQTLYYFCSDLSDDGIKSKPGFLRFCERQGRGVSLLKAASYLMHESGFSRVRGFLLGQSDLIVQDDSGIPLRFFEQLNWQMQYCGQYSRPIDVFRQYWQPDVAEAYTRNPALPLPFGFGYRWQPNRSDLMIATRVEPEIRRALSVDTADQLDGG